MVANEYLFKTAALMNELRVPVRDTYDPTINFDDFYSNGNRHHGPRLFKIEWVDTAGFPEMKGNKIYHIPPYQSAAYDANVIIMPSRYKSIGRDDPIVHECVHFLQHNTVEEDLRYIKFTGANYTEYLSQRVELEAHLIQVAYIFRENCIHRDARLSSSEQELVNDALNGVKGGSNIEITKNALLLCKERELI